MTIIVGEVNIPLIIDKTIRHKINKEIEDLNNIVNQLNLINIHRTKHPTTKAYTFSQVYMEHSLLDYVFTHKTSLKNFKGLNSHKVYSLTTLEWNEKSYYRIKFGNFTNMWKLTYS